MAQRNLGKPFFSPAGVPSADKLRNVQEENTNVGNLDPATCPSNAAKTSDSFSIFHINIQSIRNKIDKIESFLTDIAKFNNINFDVLCFSETWLTEMESQFLKIQGYKLVSNYSRPPHTHIGTSEPHHLGGGISIHVKNVKQIKVREDICKLSTKSTCEISAVEFTCNKLILITIYRTPDSNFQDFLKIFHQILIKCNLMNNIIINGDFNVKFNIKEAQTVEFLDFLEMHGLHITISESTRKQNCLDNVITNISENFSSCVIETHLSDHKAVACRFFCKKCKTKKVKIKQRPITKRGMFDVYGIIERSNWDFISAENLTLDAKFKTFIDTIREAIYVAFPEKEKIIDNGNRNCRAPWFNQELHNMREMLNFLNTVANERPSETNTNIYRNYKNKYNNKVRQTKLNYNGNYIKNSSNKAKSAWNIINKNRSNNNKTHTNSQIPSASTFNEYFSNIPNNIVDKIPQSDRDPEEYITVKNESIPSLKLREVSFNEVRDAIDDLKKKD